MPVCILISIGGGRAEGGLHNLLKSIILLRSKKLLIFTITRTSLIKDGASLFKCMIFYTVDCKKLYPADNGRSGLWLRYILKFAVRQNSLILMSINYALVIQIYLYCIF